MLFNHTAPQSRAFRYYNASAAVQRWTMHGTAYELHNGNGRT